MAEKALKSLLKILPCRPAELEKFQGFFIESGKDMLAAKPSIAELTKEYEFLLRAQKHLLELNLKYFPQSGMTEKEIIEATAKRVGFNMPAEYKKNTNVAPPPGSSSLQ